MPDLLEVRDLFCDLSPSHLVRSEDLRKVCAAILLLKDRFDEQEAVLLDIRKALEERSDV